MKATPVMVRHAGGVARYKFKACVRHAREWGRESRDTRLTAHERAEYKRLSAEAMQDARYWRGELTTKQEVQS